MRERERERERERDGGRLSSLLAPVTPDHRTVLLQRLQTTVIHFWLLIVLCAMVLMVYCRSHGRHFLLLVLCTVPVCCIIKHIILYHPLTHFAANNFYSMRCVRANKKTCRASLWEGISLLIYLKMVKTPQLKSPTASFFPALKLLIFRGSIYLEICYCENYEQLPIP